MQRSFNINLQRNLQQHHIEEYNKLMAAEAAEKERKCGMTLRVRLTSFNFRCGKED